MYCTYTYTHRNMYTHAQTHVHTDTCMYIHRNTHAQTHVHTDRHMYIHIHVHTRTHMYIQTHDTCTHRHIHMYPHTHSPIKSCSTSLFTHRSRYCTLGGGREHSTHSLLCFHCTQLLSSLTAPSANDRSSLSSEPAQQDSSGGHTRPPP
ncbi:unnamed protein product [Staurois parvus]|uniref:Uncharacterized protein n=1 Tax=Staurois parvus TaxID=386267 RepID=A0ABN9BS94_9NEOB|nr:unnamed protein product [Staurois parvus]